MALPILDGNQSATTLSSILTSGEHIPAHTVVSLGTQAITDISGAVSGSVVSISSLPAISGTVTANVAGNLNGTIENYDTDGTATHKVAVQIYDPNGQALGGGAPLPISGTVTIGSALPAGTNRIGVVTIGNIQRDGDGVQSSLLTEIGSGYLLTRSVIAAGTAQIGSVTASISNSVTIGSLPTISGTVTANVDENSLLTALNFYATDGEDFPVSIKSTSFDIPIAGTVTVGNSVTIGSLPAISGTVTANLSISSTVITSGSFSSLSSATLVPGNTARKMATVYNLGAGQLFVNAGATATTLGGGFMVALSSGDFYECDYTTTTLSAIFATAGTASWVSH
jgi:hypothetical protein